MENKSSGRGVAIGIILIILFIIAMASCDSDSSSDKYSADYYNDKEYRDNVNDIADIYGKSPDEVDRKLQAVEDAINNR